MGARAADRRDAARPLAGDEGDRTGVERPRRSRRAPARHGRARRGRGHRAGGHHRPAAGRPRTRSPRWPGAGRRLDRDSVRGGVRRVDDLGGVARRSARDAGDRVVAGTVATDSSVRRPGRGGRRRHGARRHPPTRGRRAILTIKSAGARRPCRRLALLRGARRGHRHVRRVVAVGDHGPGAGTHRLRARDRLPARARPRDPARHRPVDRDVRARQASSSRIASRSSACARSTRCCSTRPAP